MTRACLIWHVRTRSHHEYTWTHTWTYTTLAYAINWILADTCRLEHVMHYLDDFLAVYPPHLHLANHHKVLLLDTFAYLHVPVAAEKVEGLSTVLMLLSLELDTDALEILLPEDNRERLHRLVTNTVTSARFLKCELASLLGHLSFAARRTPLDLLIK